MGIVANGRVYTVLLPASELTTYQNQDVRITGQVISQAQAILPTRFEVKQGGSYQNVAISGLSTGSSLGGSSAQER